MSRKTSAVFFVTVARHLEPLLAEELVGLGIPQDQIKPTGGGVEVRGDQEVAYRICLWSRLANAVLLQLTSFEASSPEALYEGARRVRWEELMRADQTLRVSCTLQRAQLEHSHYAALKVKDAIVDRMRERLGSRPSVDRDDPDLFIHLHVQRERATLYLDLSGESLHRRGYRQETVTAPLKENVAAAVLLKADWPALWPQGAALMDPMCGSGTLIIEGALMAGDVAPGLLRKRFGFERWLDHDPILWARLVDEASQRRAAGAEALESLTLVASDRDEVAVRATRLNAAAAGLDELTVARRPLAQLRRPEEHGLLVTNAPYGERLGERQDAEALHELLGQLMVERLMGWRASVLTADEAMGRKICLRAHKRHKLFNGNLECTLLHFDVSPERVFRPHAKPLM